MIDRKRISIINGPNLNLLGSRQTDIYGVITFEDYLDVLKRNYPQVNFDYYQSNVEGEIINQLQKLSGTCDGIILNAGAYTHTSIAIADAVASIKTTVIEVHISNVFAREDFRQISYIAKHCKGSISGFGLESYRLALMSFL
jgi:3-dehydroquinate dehydratase II